MTDTPSHEAGRDADRAHRLAEHAVEELDETQADAESASAADVEKQTETPVREDPSEESSLESDVTGPGTPMP